MTDRAAEIMDGAGVPRPSGKHRAPHFAGLAPGELEGDPLPGVPWSELGYAQRLVHVYGNRMRYVATWGQWFVWDGRRWVRDETGQTARWAKLTARALTDLVLASTDNGFITEYAPLARKGENSASITSVLKHACTEDGIAIMHDDLDADPFLLNCANGTLDLRTGELRPHSPADLITKMTRGAYDPHASGPVFGKFLQRVQPDEPMRRYLARLLGHALEGRVIEHILPIFWGTGKNGKSTLTTVVVEALGDYADAADRDLLMARSFDAHPTGVADLFGLRLARLDEPDQARRLGEGTVKQLTGGDRIKARRMREDFWHFDPSHTFLMLTNHKPVITGTDDGIWRRVRLVPWPVQIPETERDGKLGDKLQLEWDAVLAWLVAGYQDWSEHGLGEPAAVTKATEGYRDESDALGRFLADHCMRQGQIKSSQLFAAWQKWCAQESEESGSQTAFSNELTNRGFDKRSKAAGNFWVNLSLVEGGGL